MIGFPSLSPIAIPNRQNPQNTSKQEKYVDPCKIHQSRNFGISVVRFGCYVEIMYENLDYRPSANKPKPFSIDLSSIQLDERVAYVDSVCAALIDSRFGTARS